MLLLLNGRTLWGPAARMCRLFSCDTLPRVHHEETNLHCTSAPYIRQNVPNIFEKEMCIWKSTTSVFHFCLTEPWLSMLVSPSNSQIVYIMALLQLLYLPACLPIRPSIQCSHSYSSSYLMDFGNLFYINQRICWLTWALLSAGLRL